ncbi:MAG: glycoside hydrolase family 3 C-terminal domain-containing protein [Bacteroidia bacterium]|nr:glycoside hydrolase family 3 C-terminal domain-containing protein [Bacteroidia bacterium]
MKIISTKTFIFIYCLITGLSGVQAQPYKDESLPVETRVKDLLSRMTMEEKFWQLFMIPDDFMKDKGRFSHGIFGIQIRVGELPDNSNPRYDISLKVNSMQKWFRENTRLGIPIIPFEEALHGLVQPGATSFPQSIGLAASFDDSLMHQVSAAIASECRSRGIRQVLSPVVNIASDVRWGRTEETYGEDPYLCSVMAKAFVSEFEKQGVITTPKHFLANVGDGGRDSYPIHFNDRLLREIYLPPFKTCITEGGSTSVMTSYNSLDGSPCSANDHLINQILKKEYGFKGFVISDAGAVGGANVLHMTAKDYEEATINSLNSGLDVILQTSYDHYPLFYKAFEEGKIPVPVIDSAVARVLRAKFRLGLFSDPYVKTNDAELLNKNPDHRELAKKAALESIVLLKNDNNILPLSKDIKSIAVIGPDADEARLGGYSGPGNDKISILKGIQNKLGSSVNIRYIKGCERTTREYITIPGSYLLHQENDSLKPGLKGEYFNNVRLEGTPEFTRYDKEINFQWTLFSPDPQCLDYGYYSVRWAGKLKSPGTGTYKIGIDGNDGYRLFINNKLIIDRWQKITRQSTLVDYLFFRDAEYDIRIEFYEPTGNAWFSLVWNAGIRDQSKLNEDFAVSMASPCDAIIFVAGIEEGEFRDRAHLSLPGKQEELISRLCATGKPVIVILVAGSAVTATNDWPSHTSAILDAWYPGEEGGDAIADILIGDYNPAGRLPITFPVFEGQLPLVYNHKPTGRGDDYLNMTGQAMYPFGYGLSYTSFSYDNLKFDKNIITASEKTIVHFQLQNTGNLDSDEVVQLYIHDVLASVARPVIELKAFQRIHLKKGEIQTISFEISPEMLSMLDKDLNTVIEPGDFQIMIGASSKDVRLKGTITVR